MAASVELQYEIDRLLPKSWCEKLTEDMPQTEEFMQDCLLFIELNYVNLDLEVEMTAIAAKFGGVLEIRDFDIISHTNLVKNRNIVFVFESIKKAKRFMKRTPSTVKIIRLVSTRLVSTDTVIFEATSPTDTFSKGNPTLDEQSFIRATKCGNGKCQQRRHLKNCARCKKISYCSRDCQMQHWKSTHKQHCPKLVNKCFIDSQGRFVCKMVPADQQ